MLKAKEEIINEEVLGTIEGLPRVKWGEQIEDVLKEFS